MSKIKIEGNASGTGTLTIAAPNTNTDRTLTLPDGAGEILTNASNITAQAMNGNAFSATKTGGSQVLSTGTITVLEYANSTFDYGSCYNTGTYTFTPNVAGVYQVNAYFQIESFSSGQVNIAIEKNGTRVSEMVGIVTTNAAYPSYDVNDLIYMNGSTDSIQIVAWQTSGSNKTIYFDRWGNFSASLVRAA